MNFAISGVDVFPLWPFLVALVVSFVSSLGGVSGAFLLLPYQVSVLGFTTPAVSSTNLLYNVVAIPGGILRHVQEGRMLWPLLWVQVAGLVPGVILGAWIRLRFLPEPGTFKLFVGLVLLYVGGRLVWDIVTRKQAAPDATGGRVRTESVGATRVLYTYRGETYSFSPIWVFLFTAVVGVVGGAYGIGGGAVVAPVMVSVFHLPVHTIAGACLAATFATSVIGVLVYVFLVPLMTDAASVMPDWALGALRGRGGHAGITKGGVVQKRVPPRWIKVILAVVILFAAGRYVLLYFL
jgi:uncharacterized membrane protein YfcA